MLRAYLTVRCPAGLPPIGSDAERAPLLMKRTVTNAGTPWEPGLTTVAMRMRLAELRATAVTLMEEQAAKEPNCARIARREGATSR
jgi:hypothetical protein